MRNILKIFSNLLLIFFLLLSSLIFYTENISSFDKEIIHNIESKLNSTLNVKTKIDSIDIDWLGHKPRIIIKNLNLTNNKNQIILKSPLSELEIDIIDSLQKSKLIVGKFTINNTSINLKQDDSTISFNNLNFFEKTKDIANIEIPLIILNNSKLKLTNTNTKTIEKLLHF